MKSKFIALFRLTAGLLLLLPFTAGPLLAVGGAAAGDIDLKIGCVMDSSPLRVRFVLCNKGHRVVRTTPLATNRNRIVIITPAGREVEHFSEKDGIKPVEVQGAGEHIWEIEIGPLLKSRKFSDPGLYGIYWFVDGFKSEKIFIYLE